MKFDFAPCHHVAVSWLGLLLWVTLSVGCLAQTNSSTPPTTNDPNQPSSNLAIRSKTNAQIETEHQEAVVKEKATFGAGCFWCVEAVFQQLKGVHSVTSGYMGGHVKNPTYAQVCSKTTGHAEVVQLEFDPNVISFDELLEVFWKTHDPTTPDQQGVDRGPQYRSAVFYHSDAQKETAESYKKKLNDANAFPNPVVTEITAASEMYVAEAEHQNFWNENPGSGYCRVNIPPKLEKLRQVFGDKLKDK
jgi:peptide-methionine (S)-S-oxide reductase